MLRQIVRLSVCLCLLILLLPLSQRPAVPSPSGPQLMPPHPRLWDKIARGEVALPAFMADPARAQAMGIEQPNEQAGRLSGSINALAVVVDFSDKVKTVTASYFDTLIFTATVAGRGSVRDYFNEVSYATVDIVTVNLPSSLGWKRAPSTYAYYVNGSNYCTGSYPQNCQKLAEDIVDAVVGVVDFSNYDNNGDGTAEPIMLIHAGPGAEFTAPAYDIWSHSWSLYTARNDDGVTINRYVIMPEYWMSVNASTSDMTIGVFSHEMGHGFWGLYDLYDYGTDGTRSWGLGHWSLMAGGSWNGPNSGGWGTDGSSPAWPDAWSRILAGWATATNVAGDGPATIPQAYNNPAPAQTILKLHTSRLASQEYFLLENREQVSGSYDEWLPGQGLFIWHVDEAMLANPRKNEYECSSDPCCLCNDSQHYLVALEQADAAHHLEMLRPSGNSGNSGDGNDPFPGGLVNRNWTWATHPESGSWYACGNSCLGVKNIGNAGASMTADLQVTCGPPPDHWVYLPLVTKRCSMGGPADGIENGGFESGRTVWTEYSTHGWPLIMNSGFPTGVTPHGGSWLVWLGGDDSDISYIQQQATVPSATPYLAYWHWIASQDACGYDLDFAQVRVNGTVVDQYDLCSSANTGGWVLHVVGLHAYVGQSVALQIRVETDDSLNSNLFVDDVSFRATPLSGPIALPVWDGDSARPRQ